MKFKINFHFHSAETLLSGTVQWGNFTERQISGRA